MTVVVLPTPLQERAGGAERVPVEGATAGEALHSLEARCPELRGWILDERGRLRQHVSLFVGDRRAALDRALGDDKELWVVQAISGGGGETELLVGTKKGLMVLRGPRGGRLRLVQRLAAGISAAGVWLTKDGGGSWRRGVDGLVPPYLPEEARRDTLQHCIHKMLRSPIQPETLYMQYHGGVYRSDDGGGSWHDIGVANGLPSQFGFPLAIHPRDPDRAWVIPLVADVDRVPPEGRLRVWETADRGASWAERGQGLPHEGAYLTVLRQAFCDDGGDPLGLWFGTESGTVFGSVDAGASWYLAAEHLPKITSVQAS